jgi:hypothetical protein
MNDEEYGTLLLRPLAGEPAGPPRIDVARAMRDGRRLRRRRWWSGGGAIAAVTATAVTGGVLAATQQQDDPVLPPDPPLPAACAVERLPLGTVRSAEVNGADAGGRYQVGRGDPVYPGKSTPLMIWHDGNLVAQVRKTGQQVVFRDINASGVAVGVSDGFGEYPYLYRNGKISKLAGGLGTTVAINDSGTIAGALTRGDRRVPVRWATPDAAPEELPLPVGTVFDDVRDIAEDGTIVATTATTSYLWLSDGTRRAVAPPADVDGDVAVGFQPVTFRHGWLYGQVMVRWTDGGKRTTGASDGPGSDGPGGAPLVGVPFRYAVGAGTWQRLGDPLDQTQFGSPTGYASTGSSDPAVFVGRQVLTLPGYPPSVAKNDSFQVAAVSDDGRVVSGYTASGYADPDRPLFPLIWRCR